eukprot:14482964-Ditylum_brightwellii.AAC.1
MTAVEQIYTKLPLDLQITKPLYEYCAGDSKLKMKIRVVADDIDVEKTMKLCNELIEEFSILPEQAEHAEQPEKKMKKKRTLMMKGRRKTKRLKVVEM